MTFLKEWITYISLPWNNTKYILVRNKMSLIKRQKIAENRYYHNELIVLYEVILN